MSTRREILIDAYNVIFAHPQLGPLVRRDRERARDQFLVFVANRLGADGSLPIVVFDAARDPRPQTETGRTGRSTTHGVQVVYARETADVWIQNHIRAHPEPRSLTLITSDRAILDTARAHGVQMLRVAEFLQLAERRAKRLREIRSSEKPERATAREIEEMRRLFEKPRDEE